MNDFNETRRLIRLKRYEKPPSGYHDKFLNEFRERQRSELLKRSSMHIFMERLAAFTSDMGKSRWLIGGAIAYGLIAILMMIDRKDVDDLNASKAVDKGGGVPSNVSPLLNPRIDLMNDLVPVLNQGEKLLVPIDYGADAGVQMVNGVIVGEGND